MSSLFHYTFMVRGFEAGLIIAIIAPLVGLFLVLRRYSLIADTLAHVSLAGVAIGLLLKMNAFFTAIIAAVASSVVIERLRGSKRISGESALAMFLSGSLALAVVLISLSKGFTVDLMSYLFGSIVTVKSSDVLTIAGLGIVVVAIIGLLYKELVYISFDEESAKVSGIPTRWINTLFIALAALTVALAMPIVGILLVSALMVIPVVTALQLRRGFFPTLMIAEAISIGSVVGGLVLSFYLNTSTGGTIVLLTLFVFSLVMLFKE